MKQVEVEHGYNFFFSLDFLRINANAMSHIKVVIKYVGHQSWPRDGGAASEFLQAVNLFI